MHNTMPIPKLYFVLLHVCFELSYRLLLNYVEIVLNTFKENRRNYV